MTSDHTLSRSSRAFVALAAIALFAAACTDSSLQPNTPEALRGLSAASSVDSVGNPPPPPPAGTPTSGYVQGTVLGTSEPGAGNDSLLTAPKVVGARVGAFPVTGGTLASPTLGPEAGSTLTGADGKFALPSVPGGEYVVTITPPADAVWRGVWLATTIHDQSHVFPWWVVLRRK